MRTAAPLPLAVHPLTREAFAPYGEVVEVSDAVRHFTINAGNTERYHDLANIEPGPDGRVIVSIFRGQPRGLPFTVQMMERHPLASQAFVPMSGKPYLVVVAPAGAPFNVNWTGFEKLRMEPTSTKKARVSPAQIWAEPVFANRVKLGTRGSSMRKFWLEISKNTLPTDSTLTRQVVER